MAGRFALTHLSRILALLVLSSGIATWAIHSGQGRDPGRDSRNMKINEAIAALWERADGPVSRGETDRAWVWGPEPISTSTEYYADSPTGTRTLVYFDKGRLDILNPDRDPADEWYAAGGLLVSEMLAGRIQFGRSVFVERSVPAIPIAGDRGQPDPVTYATLAPYSSVWTGRDEIDLELAQHAGRERDPGDRTGRTITARLDAGGHVGRIDGDSAATYGHYDAVTGHNAAAPFADWARAQPYTSIYLIGHPISEPYWIDTIIGGESKLVLIQAFERRVLTYTPDKRDGWQVEAANVGRHYRTWRELPEIDDPELVPLASGVPSGEEIVGAALETGVDPFMLAAIGKAVSNGNPFVTDESGARGILGVHPELHDLPPAGQLEDPVINARNGARALKLWIPDWTEDYDWRAVLADYFRHGEPEWPDPALEDLVHRVLEEYTSLKEAYPPLEVDPPTDLDAAGGAPVDPTIWGGVLDTGPAAYYDPSYETAWWVRTQNLYASWGLIAEGYEPDPNGYYCVRPGYIPGERLRLRANGVTITCTVGDMVADQDLYNWLYVSNWSIELSWSAFTALGLQYSNYVEVDFPGTWAKSPPPAYPPAKEQAPQPESEPQPEPTPTPQPEPEATAPSAASEPDEEPELASDPTPGPASPTPEPEPPVEPVDEPEPEPTTGAREEEPAPDTR